MRDGGKGLLGIGARDAIERARGARGEVRGSFRGGGGVLVGDAAPVALLPTAPYGAG